MDEHLGNVVTLPKRAEHPSHSEVRAAVGYLDELNRLLEQLSPHVMWSAMQWMIASTPFRMRLVGVRHRLRELTASRPVSGQADIHWFLEFQDASIKVEHRIRDLKTCLSTLQHTDTSPSARARETELFTARRSDLVDSALQVRSLLLERLPELAGRR